MWLLACMLASSVALVPEAYRTCDATLHSMIQTTSQAKGQFIAPSLWSWGAHPFVLCDMDESIAPHSEDGEMDPGNHAHAMKLRRRQ